MSRLSILSMGDLKIRAMVSRALRTRHGHPPVCVLLLNDEIEFFENRSLAVGDCYRPFSGMGNGF